MIKASKLCYFYKKGDLNLPGSNCTPWLTLSLPASVQKYKSNKEMMPKAAFQFGVKMSDGRKGHKQLGKVVEQKEQKQLKKIQGMLSKDQGGKYAKAFAEPADQGTGAAFSKRRRI